MSRVVSKLSSVLVRPASPEPPMAGGNIQVQLSPYDQIFAGYPTTALLVFSDPIHQAAERIKTALSQALVHFPLLAGRLVPGHDHIACTSDGVSFVAATASISLSIKDIQFSSTLREELGVYYPDDRCGPTDPLLLVQLTEFSCGGFVVGVTWNHGVADGAGMGDFLRSVGELARGLSVPSVVPVACDDSLKVGAPVMGPLGRFFGSLGRHRELVMLHLTIPADLIRSVKDAVGSDAGGRSCTVFEAVTAVLWKCRTRAAMYDDPDAATGLSFSVDTRSYVGASHGYYRNCTLVQLAVAKCAAVANGNIMDLVKLIQHAKDEIPRSMQMHDLELDQCKLLSYNVCGVTYWPNLGFRDADFGAGKPATVLSYRHDREALPANIVTSSGKDGGCNVMSLSVTEEHAQTFLHEIANFTAA